MLWGGLQGGLGLCWSATPCRTRLWRQGMLASAMRRAPLLAVPLLQALDELLGEMLVAPGAEQGAEQVVVVQVRFWGQVTCWGVTACRAPP